MNRGWLTLVALAGCWAQEDLVHGEFTPAQWDTLRRDISLPALPDRCALPRELVDPDRCDLAAQLGQRLFFDKRLSGPGTVSCAVCHDPDHGFADVNNVSPTADAAFTRRNTISLTNLALKDQFTTVDAFPWTGRYATPSQVVELVALPGPMASGRAHVLSVVRTDPAYAQLAWLSAAGNQTDDKLFRAALAALDAYMRRLVSVGSPFDRFLTGLDDQAMPASAIRGFGVFVGRGMCLECHSGPLLSDFAFHATGVPQTGEHVIATDLGRGEVTNRPEDDGKFLTPALRNVTQTWPYMHQGWDTTLGAVIEHYRHGGADAGFAGVKDPLMVPAEISDEDVADLEAFLGQLTGAEIPFALRTDPFTAVVAATCTSGNGNAGLVCAGTCRDIANDRDNCGGCGTRCSASAVCMGACYEVCSPSLSACPIGCVDAMSDPANCGTCGHTCATTCVMGQCAP